MNGHHRDGRVLESQSVPFNPTVTSSLEDLGVATRPGIGMVTRWVSSRWLPSVVLGTAIGVMVLFTLTGGLSGGGRSAADVALTSPTIDSPSSLSEVVADDGESDAGADDDADGTSVSTTTERPSTTSTTSAVAASSVTELATTSSMTTTTAPSLTTTEAPPSTTVAATEPPQPATVGGRVSFASTGEGAKGIRVKLSLDEDRNSESDEAVANATTSTGGGYSWTVEPGCFVIEFLVPSEQKVTNGSASDSFCVDEGVDTERDIVISDPEFATPTSCDVQIGNRSSHGVEIRNLDLNWAPAYQFLGAKGQVLHTTTDFGPPDDVELDERSIEWTSDGNGFEESAVFAVAALHEQGIASAAVECERS